MVVCLGRVKRVTIALRLVVIAVDVERRGPENEVLAKKSGGWYRQIEAPVGFYLVASNPMAQFCVNESP